jgi:hypothetical protein
MEITTSGSVLVEALMWPVRIETLGVAVQDGAGVGFVVGQQVVGALPADAADEPFGIAVRAGRVWRDLDDLDVYGGEHRVERGGELGVAVPDQEPECAGSVVEVDDQVAGLLGGPVAGRMGGDAEDVHSSGEHLYHDQDVDATQGDGVEVVSGGTCTALSTRTARSSTYSCPPAATPWRHAGSSAGRWSR